MSGKRLKSFEEFLHFIVYVEIVAGGCGSRSRSRVHPGIAVLSFQGILTSSLGFFQRPVVYRPGTLNVDQLFVVGHCRVVRRGL